MHSRNDRRQREPNASGLVRDGQSTSISQSTMVLSMTMAIAAAVLGALHLILAKQWADLAGSGTFTPPPLRPALNVTYFVANLFLVSAVVLGGFVRTFRQIRWCVIGYAAMVWLMWPSVRILPENVLILALSVMIYAGLIRRPWLLGYLFLFLACQRFLPAYLYPSFLLTALLYTTLGPFVRSWRQGRERFLPLCHLAGLMLLTGLLLPIIYFCSQSSSQDIQQRLREKDVLEALTTSLKTSATATGIVLVLGVPMAYAMVRRAFPGRALVDTLIDLPIVVPSPIAGLALLAFIGPKAPMGMFLMDQFNFTLMDSVGAIVLAQAFVSSPFLIRASMVAFSAVDERYENIARTLGSSTLSAFRRVTIPLAFRGILIGVILTWFRAMAEFGSLQIMGYEPHTIPILAYQRFIMLHHTESQSVGALILLLCLGVIIGMWIIRTMPNLLGRFIGVSDAAG